jgi:polysaccharide export outer membrane protein
MNAPCTLSIAAALLVALSAAPAAQQPTAPPRPANGGPAAPAGATLPQVVRPDGRISLPLLNDVRAAGYTPEQLKAELEKQAAKFLADPNATVVVKEINSRKVFVTGQVAKPGSYPLIGEMNVLQLLAHVGGLLEYADAKNIVILRNENGREQRFRFNYKDIVKGKNVQQNIALKPGDTVVVP